MQRAGPVYSGIDVDDEKSTVALEHPVYFPQALTPRHR